MIIDQLYRKLTLSLVITACTGAVSAQSHYYYFKHQTKLSEYSNEIAILRDASTQKSDITRAIKTRGIAATDLEQTPIAGWWKGPVDTGAAVRRQTMTNHMRDVVSSATLDTSNQFVSPVFAGRDGGYAVVTPSILVGFNKNVTSYRAEQIISQTGAGTIAEANYGGMDGVYKITPASRNGYRVLDDSNNLAEQPEVSFAEPDMMFIGHSDFTPNDPGFAYCWGLFNPDVAGEDMHAPDAWDISQGSPTIKVAVLDNGAQQDHPDINQLPGYDVIDTTGDGGPRNECDKHGTPVAGCISAAINNSIGTVGIAPLCKVVSIRTFASLTDCSGSWTTFVSSTVDALEIAETQGVRVTNNSNSYGFQSATIATKYAQTYAAGMIHFASAGNNTTATLGYPSSLPGVNSVAATDRFGSLSSFSNYGTGLDFSSPGSSVYTCDRTGTDGYNTGDYVYMNGTSFASPYASGVAALLLSARPALTPAEVESLMQSTATDKGAPGYDITFGWGLVNAHKALKKLTAAAADWNLYE